MKEKVILIIRDGWGYRKEKELNAISKAKTFVDDKLKEKYPWTLLKSSGEAVGLPQGYQGNSEVGHLTIGSGRIIEQSLMRINKAIKDGSFFKNKALIKTLKNCQKNNSCLHIIGLLQKEGVHSHLDHLFALLDFCQREKFNKVFIHLVTDGRDAPVKKSKDYLKELNEKMKKVKIGEIVTVSGRYYAMDRDKRWERTKKAYQAIIEGKSKEVFKDPLIRIKESHKKQVTDEFIIPSIKEGYRGVQDDDSIIFYNLRTDRPRQLTQAILEKDFKPWKRKKPRVFFTAMTNYYNSMKAEALFKEQKIKNVLGEVLSKNKIKQLRISETEKYPHVTFFFNGQREKPYPGEERILISSPKVKTYDEKPEMSIRKIVFRVKKEINKDRYQFILINLVNADMVGHTGDKKAIIEAVQAVDKAVGEILDCGFLKNYSFLIFADHGNAEDQREEWRTSHTINPVPFILISKKELNLKRKGGLKNIASTVLKLMQIKKPKEMEEDLL